MFNLACAVEKKFLSYSMPTNDLPAFRQATPVEPLPMQKSRTTPRMGVGTYKVFAKRRGLLSRMQPTFLFAETIVELYDISWKPFAVRYGGGFCLEAIIAGKRRFAHDLIRLRALKLRIIHRCFLVEYKKIFVALEGHFVGVEKAGSVGFFDDPFVAKPFSLALHQVHREWHLGKQAHGGVGFRHAPQLWPKRGEVYGRIPCVARGAVWRVRKNHVNAIVRQVFNDA